MAYQNNNHFVWFCKRKSGKFGKKIIEKKRYFVDEYNNQEQRKITYKLVFFCLVLENE